MDEILTHLDCAYYLNPLDFGLLSPSYPYKILTIRSFLQDLHRYIVAPTKDQLLLHQKAARLLEAKLARIPKRVFMTGLCPIIHEYYTKASILHVHSIPEQYQLEFLLGRYNALVSVDFRTVKTPGADVDIAKAIWYWQIDKSHSFSRNHAVIRYNIMVAVVVGASANPGAYCTGSAQQFLLAFVRAWKEAVSRSSSFTARDAFLKL